MPEVLMKVENLEKSFTLAGASNRKLLAVNRVSFEVYQNRTLGLVGESGCGKSTLGRVILNLIPPTSGSVIFAGGDLCRLRGKEMRTIRQNMQIIFQDPYSSLNPRFSVFDIIAEPFIVHGIMRGTKLRSAVSALLDQVGLPKNSMERFPHEFSGGQRQRIGIARAIALKPKFIVADEPVSALDVSIQAQILNLLRDLQRDLGLSYLFVSHNLAVIKHISDDIAVMYLGRIVELTTKLKLFSAPKHPYTQMLLSSILEPDEARSVHPSISPQVAELPSPISPPSGCHFHPRCFKATQICREISPEVQELGVPGSSHKVACHHASS